MFRVCEIAFMSVPFVSGRLLFPPRATNASVSHFPLALLSLSVHLLTAGLSSYDL